jgi:hypothetical protein
MRGMGLRKTIAIAILVLVSVDSAPADREWVVRDTGVGAAKIGMTLQQLNKALSEDFSLQIAKDEHCSFVFPSQHTNIALMIIAGKFVRTDIDYPGVSTAEGIQVGDTEALVKKTYGSRVKVEPHAYYGPERHYLTVRSEDGRHGIRFETDGTKIVMYYAGTYKAIQYIEGCQ